MKDKETRTRNVISHLFSLNLIGRALFTKKKSKLSFSQTKENNLLEW